MTVDFCIDNDDMFECPFWFEMDWTSPVLPRIGESFTNKFFVRFVKPASFYNSLTKEKKNIWKEVVEYGMREETDTLEEAEDGALESLLDFLPLEVNDVCWTVDDNGEIRTIIYL